MNKKGKVDWALDEISFMIAVAVFAGIVLWGVSNAGSEAGLLEQVYAKQIALIIDKGESGMILDVDLFNAYNIAKENNFDGQIINIDNEDNIVNVKLKKGGGFNFKFFNDLDVSWSLDKERKKLKLDFLEG